MKTVFSMQDILIDQWKQCSLHKLFWYVNESSVLYTEYLDWSMKAAFSAHVVNFEMLLLIVFSCRCLYVYYCGYCPMLCGSDQASTGSPCAKYD